MLLINLDIDIENHVDTTAVTFPHTFPGTAPYLGFENRPNPPITQLEANSPH